MFAMQRELTQADYLRQVKEGETRVVGQNLGTGVPSYRYEVPCVRLLCMANFLQLVNIRNNWYSFKLVINPFLCQLISATWFNTPPL